MEVEQAIFTSSEVGPVKGYHLVARSAGVGEEVAREISRWAPTHSSLISADMDDWSLNCFPLDSRWLTLSRTAYGRPEYSGRGGLQVVTIILVLSREQFALYSHDAWTLARTGLALGCLTLPSKIEPQLAKVRLPDRALIRRARKSVGGDATVAQAAEILQQGDKVALVGLEDPLPALEYLIGRISEDGRKELSFTTGLTPSVQRPFQLHFLPRSDESMRAKLASMGVQCLEVARHMAPT